MEEKKRTSKVLVGKTCHTMVQAQKFVEDCVDKGVAGTYWVNEFVIPGEKGDDKRILVTFWIDKMRFERVEDIGKTMILHRKANGTMFTINALNKLIETSTGTTDHSQVAIDWDQYKNKLICMLGGALGIYDLKLIYKEVHHYDNIRSEQ